MFELQIEDIRDSLKKGDDVMEFPPARSFWHEDEDGKADHTHAMEETCVKVGGGGLSALVELLFALNCLPLNC